MVVVVRGCECYGELSDLERVSWCVDAYTMVACRWLILNMLMHYRDRLLLLFTVYATYNGAAYGIDKSYIGV